MPEVVAKPTRFLCFSVDLWNEKHLFSCHFKSRNVYMLKRLKGKHSLAITAAQGIGIASTIALAREGAKVYATDINSENLNSIRGQILENFENFEMDVTNNDSIHHGARERSQTFCSTAPGLCITELSWMQPMKNGISPWTLMFAQWCARQRLYCREC